MWAEFQFVAPLSGCQVPTSNYVGLCIWAVNAELLGCFLHNRRSLSEKLYSCRSSALFIPYHLHTIHTSLHIPFLLKQMVNHTQLPIITECFLSNNNLLMVWNWTGFYIDQCFYWLHHLCLCRIDSWRVRCAEELWLQSTRSEKECIYNQLFVSLSLRPRAAAVA